MRSYVMDSRLSPSPFRGCRGQSYTTPLTHYVRGVMSILGQCMLLSTKRKTIIASWACRPRGRRAAHAIDEVYSELALLEEQALGEVKHGQWRTG
jgi:hypothetical protein